MIESPTIRWVLQNLKTSSTGEEETLNDHAEDVSVLTKKASAFYEKIRYVIDYKEEHSIRRSGIERILRRQIIIERRRDFELSFLKELVGVGYIAHNFVSDDLVSKVKVVIEKYLALESEQIQLSTLVNLMATEVERLLYPKIEEELIVEAFHSNISQQIKFSGEIDENLLKIQTYVACRRSLLEEDNETLLFSVITKYIPELPTLTKESIGQYKDKLVSVLPHAKADIEGELSWRIYSRIKNQTVYFLVITEIIKKYGTYSEVILNDSARLETEIKSFLSEEFKKQQETLRKSGNRAVVYVLLTKITLALAFELPFEKLFHETIDYYALGTNIVFHPLLLLMIVKSTSLPGPKDEAMIITGVQDVLTNKLTPIKVKPERKASFVTTFFYLLYALLFVISFGAVVWLLEQLNFSEISIILFIFFLTVVSYFGFRLRHNTKKWKVHDADDSVLYLLWHFLTLPIVRTGRWLSNKFSSVNIFVLLFDFILETPFKFVLGTFDEFVSFLKEKRDDPY